MNTDTLLCRAKRIYNDEWIEGYVLTNKLGTYIITEKNPHECTQYHYLPVRNFFLSNSFTSRIRHIIEIEEYCRVKPETLCRCTGLKDKNGKLIFEGDVIEDDDGEIWVEWDDLEAGFQFNTIYGIEEIFPTSTEMFEIIGNKFDSR